MMVTAVIVWMLSRVVTIKSELAVTASPFCRRSRRRLIRS